MLPALSYVKAKHAPLISTPDEIRLLLKYCPKLINRNQVLVDKDAVDKK